MLKDYPYPSEMPKVFIDDDGIVNILFGSLMMTADHVVHSVAIHRKLAPDRKSPVMIVGEAAIGVRGLISKVGNSDWIVEVTSAVAIVTQTKVGRVLGNVFIGLQKNSYPTKLFDTKEDARAWLQQYR